MTFNKGLRYDQFVKKVMHVKDNRLFVIAYNDLTFDLIDIEQLQTFVKEQEQKDKEGASSAVTAVRSAS